MVDGFLVVTLVPLKTTFVAPPPIPACTISLPTTAGEQDVCSSATTRWPQPIRADRVRRTRNAGTKFETVGPRSGSKKNHLSAKTSALSLSRPVPVFTQGRSRAPFGLHSIFREMSAGSLAEGRKMRRRRRRRRLQSGRISINDKRLSPK